MVRNEGKPYTGEPYVRFEAAVPGGNPWSDSTKFSEFYDRITHHWLFVGAKKTKHITTRTMGDIFSSACKKAEIKKEVSVHCMRPSFATHLLESGVDLRYIQELLGHKSSKTNEIYTHVSNKNLRKIKSPLDDLKL